MTCNTCNGWGVTYMIKTTPPSTVEKRLAERKKGPNSFMLAESLCKGCGGFGTRPADR